LGTKEAVDFANRWNTYPQILRAAGYQTSVTGKWQLATLEFHPQHCRDAGFDSWCVWQIWRQGAKTTRHWNPTLNHDGMVRDDIAERFGPDVLADYVIEQMKTAVASKRPFYIHHNMLLPHEPVVETPADRERRVAPSLPGMIAYMDSLCGRIIRAVDELGIAEETYIIFMGDNGTDLMKVRQTVAGAVRGGKRDLNDAGTHVPLVVRCPGKVPSGVVVEDLVDSTDWFPTFCELAGTAIPSDIRLDGVSFAGRLHGGAPSERTFVVGGYGGDISIYDGSWRLNMNKNVLIDARNLPREELVLHSSPDFESQATRLRRIAQEVLGPQ
jgi:arylsulfatase A